MGGGLVVWVREGRKQGAGAGVVVFTGFNQRLMILADGSLLLLELSLTVPITNSLAFLFTVLGEWWAEGKVISRGMDLLFNL